MLTNTKPMIVGALLLVAAAPCFGAASTTADLPSDAKAAAKIRIAHWKTIITEERGGAQVTWSIENWLKGDSRWRRESSDGVLMIFNGQQKWEYTKRANKYSYRNDPDRACKYNMLEFVPDHVADVQRQKNTKATIAKTKVVISGVKYSAIEVNVPKDGLMGPCRTQILTDPHTGLVKAKTSRKFNVDGSRVISEEHIEYDYNKQNVPDDLFVFQPPDGAEEADWGNGK